MVGTLGFLNVPDGSLVTSHPNRPPAPTHLFDRDPRVRTETVDPKTPIGTKGLLPKPRRP